MSERRMWSGSKAIGLPVSKDNLLTILQRSTRLINEFEQQSAAIEIAADQSQPVVFSEKISEELLEELMASLTDVEHDAVNHLHYWLLEHQNEWLLYSPVDMPEGHPLHALQFMLVPYAFPPIGEDEPHYDFLLKVRSNSFPNPMEQLARMSPDDLVYASFSLEIPLKFDKASDYFAFHLSKDVVNLVERVSQIYNLVSKLSWRATHPSGYPSELWEGSYGQRPLVHVVFSGIGVTPNKLVYYEGKNELTVAVYKHHVDPDTVFQPKVVVAFSVAESQGFRPAVGRFITDWLKKFDGRVAELIEKIGV